MKDEPHQFECGDIVRDSQGLFSGGDAPYYLLLSRDTKRGGVAKGEDDLCFMCLRIHSFDGLGNITGGNPVEEVWDEDLAKTEFIGRFVLPVKTPPPAPEDGRTPRTDKYFDTSSARSYYAIWDFCKGFERELNTTLRENAGLKEKLAEANEEIRVVKAQRDHHAEVRTKMEDELSEIRSSAFCVYCGSVCKKDGIADHIMSCEKHPIRAWALEMEQLQSTVASLRAAAQNAIDALTEFQSSHPDEGRDVAAIRLLEEALSTTPAPAMVPVEDVKPLLGILRTIRRDNEIMCPGVGEMEVDNMMEMEMEIDQAIGSFETKHPSLK